VINWRTAAAVASLVFTLAACSGGNTGSAAGTDQSAVNCSGSCANANAALSIANVEQIIAQAIAEAQARNVKATIAVVDRVGNVLAVYRMGEPSARQVVIATALNSAGEATVPGGLEGIRLPTPTRPFNIDGLAAIAKAITGAYFSTEGNAFSTRTASQIIESHFDPGELGQPSGPLFGVQFSQLPCSDFSARFAEVLPGVNISPQRSPLGLSADPGGFPLYADGTVVGGVGAIADGVYGIDNGITGPVSIDEAIAYAATYGFAAPLDRRADEITIDGRSLLFSNFSFDNLAVNPANAPAFADIPAAIGTLIAVPGYADASVRAGVAFGQPQSGVQSDGGINFQGLDAFVFVDSTGEPAYAPIAGMDGPNALTQAEVSQVLRSALGVANRARSQIRLPLGSYARVTISVVDTLGNDLGMVASRDAPLFGADVSLQKARSAVLMSSKSAADYVAGMPPALYLATDMHQVLDDYIINARAFIGDPNAFGDGVIAYSDRAIGNLSRPFYPDGIDGPVYGPLSKPDSQWSPFSTGLQLDLSLNAILQDILHAAGAGISDVDRDCTGVSLAISPTLSLARVAMDKRLANGLQIFAGSVPIFRGATLVGAIGVSGDGVDQDDMVAILGLADASDTLKGSIANAPPARRADTLTPHGTRLKYVECPQAPFLNSDVEDACAGL
jgi:uncharacterized protein GlcG (DUF336 family)